jgi:hypothetical protein
MKKMEIRKNETKEPIRKDLVKNLERPTPVTIYLVLMLLELAGSVYSLPNIGQAGVIFLGAYLSGMLLIGYTIFWSIADAVMIYGIWKRKQWLPDIAIPILAVLILIGIGQLFYLDKQVELAIAQSGQQLTQAQIDQSISMGKTIAMIVQVIILALYTLVIRAIHMNREYFSEK